MTIDTTYCANHPAIATSLRCNRCEKLICSRCAVLTPTGYRCKDCLNNQQKTFDTALGLAFGLASFISFLGSLFIRLLPLAFLTILVAPLIGSLIGEVIRRITGKRRSRRLFTTVAVATALGALPMFLLQLVGFGLISVIWQGVYLFLASSSAYYRLSGITLRF